MTEQVQERKKPGRKPKAQPPETVALLAHMETLKRTYPEHLQELNNEPVPSFSVQPTIGVETAQQYAQRVWDGQSVDVPRGYRLERVRKALEAQGMSMEGVSL